MKIFSIIILAFSLQFGNTQDANALFKAIGEQNINVLSDQFVDDLELTIGTDQDFYSKSEAKQRLQSFFSEVKPSSGTFLHKGSSKDKTSNYSVGEMNSAKGKYRVFIYFEGNKISSISFNPE